MKEKNNGAVLSWMNRVVGKEKANIAVLLAVQAVLGVTGVCYAFALRAIINHAVAGSRTGFWRSMAAFAGLMLFQLALRALNRYFEEHSRATLENCFKKRLFAALLTRDYASVTAVHSGEWMNRLTSDTVVVADGLTQILPGASGMAIKITGALAAMIWIEPRLLYVLIPGGLLLVCSTAFRKIMKRLHRKIQQADGETRIYMQERLENLMVVRTFARERESLASAERLMQAHRAARMARNHFSNLCNVGFGAAMHGTYVLGTLFCGYGILSGTMSYGNLMAILQLIGQIQNPFANITGFLPRYYAMLASAERLMEAEAFAPEPEEVLPQEECERFYHEEFVGLQLKNVSFSYGSPAGQEKGESSRPPVLSGVNLLIEKGEYAAFTGASGCGKSTVLKLLMCLYSPDAGERLLLTKKGARPLTAGMRSLFAYVPQGNQLMAGTIREIVSFGSSEIMQQEEKIHSALRIACADTFIGELERGIDTVLGEHGAGLSEGQMQRIAIARAICSGRPILLLDEATSALDESTEKQLLHNLRGMTDKTVIIITHRRAVLDICDKKLSFGTGEVLP